MCVCIYTYVCVCMYVGKPSTMLPASPTHPISPKQQQHRGSHGPDQLVINKKHPEEEPEENQPVEATDNGTGDKDSELDHR